MKDRSSQLMMEAGIGSMSIRYGSLSMNNSRIQSGFQVYSNEWYHVVVVFDPILGRTTLHLNGKSVTLDSLGFDNNDDLVTVAAKRRAVSLRWFN